MFLRDVIRYNYEGKISTPLISKHLDSKLASRHTLSSNTKVLIRDDYLPILPPVRPNTLHPFLGLRLNEDGGSFIKPESLEASCPIPSV